MGYRRLVAYGSVLVLFGVSVAIGYCSYTPSSAQPVKLSGHVNAEGNLVIHPNRDWEARAAIRTAERGRYPDSACPQPKAAFDVFFSLSAVDRRAVVSEIGDSRWWTELLGRAPLLDPSPFGHGSFLGMKSDFVADLLMSDLPSTYQFELSSMILIVQKSYKDYGLLAPPLSNDEMLVVFGRRYTIFKDREPSWAVKELSEAIKLFPDAVLANDALGNRGWTPYPDDLSCAQRLVHGN